MKKKLFSVCILISLLFVSCAEKTTEVTVKEAFLEVLESYNFAEVAESFLDNEDGSITYIIETSILEEMKAETVEVLAANIEDFIIFIKEANPDIVAELGFSDDGTVLEATVTDAHGAQNGLIFLIIPSYPHILALQIFSGIEPTGLTLKSIDAVTGEVFEETLPF